MIIGTEYEIIQQRTGYRYHVRIIDDMRDGRFVGLTLNDSPQWSAGAKIAINPEDVIL